MVSITTTGSSIIFTFEDCPTYLQNGTIELPKNSLSLTVDGSGMATYRKAQSNDIFVSVSLDELGMTEEELITEFADMVSTGGGGEEEEIQELSGKVSTISGQVSANTANISTLSGSVSGKQDTLVSGTNIKTINNTSLLGEGNITIEGGGTVTIDPGLDPDSPNPVANSALTAIITGISGDVETISGSVTAHTSDSTIHVTSQDKTNWDAKADASDIEAAVSGKADSSAVTEEIAAAVSGKADTSALTEHTSDSTIHVTSSDKTTWNAKADISDITDAISGKADSSAVTEEITAAVSGKADSSALTAFTTSGQVQGMIDDELTVVTSNNIYFTLNGNQLANGHQGYGTFDLENVTGDSFTLTDDACSFLATSSTSSITASSEFVDKLSGITHGITSGTTNRQYECDFVSVIALPYGYKNVMESNFSGITNCAYVDGDVFDVTTNGLACLSLPYGGTIQYNKTVAQCFDLVAQTGYVLVPVRDYKSKLNNGLSPIQPIDISNWRTRSGDVSADTKAYLIESFGHDPAYTAPIYPIDDNGTKKIGYGLVNSITYDGATINTALNAKADASDLSTLSGTVTGLSSDVSTLSGTVTGISSDVSTLSGTVTGISSDVSTLSGTVTSHTADTTVHVTSTDKTNWNGAVTALGGVKLVKITQSAYDQLQTKDPDTLYIITAS